jgi:hypothetical protein
VRLMSVFYLGCAFSCICTLFLLMKLTLPLLLQRGLWVHDDHPMFCVMTARGASPGTQKLEDGYGHFAAHM